MTTVLTAAWHWHSAASTTSSASTASGGSSSSLPPKVVLALGRPLRIPAEAAGVNERELIDAMASARQPRQVIAIAERLGVIGGDAAVDALAQLLRDRRPGVAYAAAKAMGNIGSDHAVEMILDGMERGHPYIRYELVNSLARANTPRAREVLMARAGDPSDPLRLVAISALGEIGSLEVVEYLGMLMEGASYNVTASVIHALSMIGSVESEALLLELVEVSDVRIRSLALSSLTRVDDIEVQAQLMEIAATGDPQSAAAAMQVLGQSGVRSALPLLAELARTGPPNLRGTAVQALAGAGGDGAVEILRELLDTGNATISHEVASALATIGSDEAVEALLSAATDSRYDRTAVVYALQNLQDPRCEEALLAVARTGRLNERQIALQQLVTVGNDEALAIAVDMATMGSRGERQNAIYLLGEASGEVARDALYEIALEARGQPRIAALQALMQSHPDDPTVNELLTQSLLSGSSEETHAAAYALAQSGTPEARRALLSALGDDNPQIATAAASVLGQFGNHDEVREALVSAARTGEASQRQAALSQLIDSGAPEAVTVAAEILRGGDDEVTYNAVWSLVQQSSDEAHRVLVDAAGSQHTNVREAVAQNLGGARGLAEGQAMETLQRLSTDEEESVRANALSSLGQLGSSAAIEHLRGVAERGATGDRVAAISALSNSEHRQAAEVITGLVRDEDPQVAVAAVNATYRLGDDASDALRWLLSDPDAAREVRLAAANQLSDRGGVYAKEAKQLIAELTESDAQEPALPQIHVSPGHW